MPYFWRNWFKYSRLRPPPSMGIRIGRVRFCTADRFSSAGATRSCYFLQDLWAAKLLQDRGATDLLDVGSRVDGFVAHVLMFTNVRYMDIRPMESTVERLAFVQGSATHLSFESDSQPFVTCLHVIEHIGLGRYGDPVDPRGHLAAAAELARVVAPGGLLLLSTPVGREQLWFDAHRIFDPQTIVDAFAPLDLVRFSLIGDDNRAVVSPATFSQARECHFGCGIFEFTKKQA